MAPAENMKCVRCMTGPTASGKSGAAVRLAKSVGGEIINADALQVYKDLHILSARPTQAEMDGVPHHLFGHIDGAQRYSVGQWLREAVPVIQDVLARGHVPIIVGGTGLYFKALTEGLAHVPEPNSTAKTQSKTLLEQKGIAALRREAERVDPVAAARVLGNDPHRLLRIVAVAHGTQKRLSAWQAMTQPVIPRGYWHGMIIAPPRDELYAKIETRFDAMISAGGLEERLTYRLCARLVCGNYYRYCRVFKAKQRQLLYASVTHAGLPNANLHGCGAKLAKTILIGYGRIILGLLRH